MLKQSKIKQLIKSGDWMIRFDNEGKSVHPDAAGFVWKPEGEWTEAKDWNTKPECGHGLHGQSPKAAGECMTGSRMVLCETKGEQIVINQKIKVQFGKIIAINEKIPPIFIEEILSVGGSLNLWGYNHPLPAGLKK